MTSANRQLEQQEEIVSTGASIGILKPDIVFFGEGLPETYHESIKLDKTKCDLLIVIGSSLKVKPVANIPHLLDKSVPQILINRESLKHLNFDVELLGDCDVIINEILLRLATSDSTTTSTASSASKENWSDILEKGVNSFEPLEMIENEEAEKFIEPPEEQQPILEAEHPELHENDEEAPPSAIQSPIKHTKDYLKENSFLHLKPNMYVFHGAELNLRNTRKKLSKLRHPSSEPEASAQSLSATGQTDSKSQLLEKLILKSLSSGDAKFGIDTDEDEYDTDDDTDEDEDEDDDDENDDDEDDDDEDEDDDDDLGDEVEVNDQAEVNKSEESQKDDAQIQENDKKL
jgi:hypothetical protein